MKLTITGFSGCTVKLIDEAGYINELDIFQLCDFEEDEQVLITIAGKEIPARICRFDGAEAILEYTAANGEIKFINKPIKDLAALRVGGQIQIKTLQTFEA
ncbi:MAG: hypothetical protein WCP79_13210 [Bacillota bacterium]